MAAPLPSSSGMLKCLFVSFQFIVVTSFRGVMVWCFMSVGGRHSCVCGSRVCLLCVHCLICWKEVVSICDHGALHWLCKRYHIGISLFFFLEYFSLCPSSKVIASFAVKFCL